MLSFVRMESCLERGGIYCLERRFVVEIYPSIFLAI